MILGESFIYTASGPKVVDYIKVKIANKKNNFEDSLVLNL